MELLWLELLLNLAPVLLLIAVGYGFGSLAEYRHYRSIRKREGAMNDLIVITTKTLPDYDRVPETALVAGNVVVSVDYFKRFVAYLRMIFGGRVHTYESLVDRGRREAILRMQEKARALGASKIFNTRLETSSISKGRNRRAVGSIEVLAYGTAVVEQS